MAKPRAKVFIDSDTGNEIIYFIRRKRPYLYLRDKVTKRFIRRLRQMDVRAFFLIDYIGRKANPIYVDAMATKAIVPQDIEYLDKIEDRLMNIAIEGTAKYFGWYVIRVGIESGYEYGSKITISKDVAFKIVWYHHKGKEPKKREETLKW
jgi:hypothetical protein